MSLIRIHHQSIAVAVVALAITTLVGALLVRIEGAYLDHYPYFLDSSYYSWRGLFCLFRLIREPAIQVASSEIVWNDRFALRTVPLIMFAPKLLGHKLGQLATALPFFLLFATLIGSTALRRTNSLLYATSVVALFGSLPIFYDFRIGLGTFWLDPVGALLVGACSICALNYTQESEKRWLIAFAAIAGLIPLTRYLSLAFLALVCGPVLLVHLLSVQIKNSKSIKKEIVIPYAIAAVVFSIVGGWYFLMHLGTNLFYYTNWGYDNNRGLLFSLKLMLPWFLDALGKPTLVVLVGFALYQIFSQFNGKSTNSENERTAPKGTNLFFFLWLAFSVLAFVIVVLHMSTEVYPGLYAIPGFLLASTFPNLLVKFEKLPSKAIKTVSILFFTAAIINFTTISMSLMWRASHPSVLAAATKQYNIAFSDFLAQRKPPYLWMSFVANDAVTITYQCWQSHKFFAHLPPFPFFYFTTNNIFTGRRIANEHATDSDTKKIITAADRWLDYALVLDDPQAAQKPENDWLETQRARDMATTVAFEVSTNPSWKKVFTYDAPRYGRVACYHNTACNGLGFRSMMTGVDIRP